MDVLVVSGCSGKKRYENPPIDCEGIDSTHPDELLERYPDLTAPVAEMYTGDEHQLVKSAVSNLREIADVSWVILSAGYGLLQEREEIVAYDCTLSDIKEVRVRAMRLGYDTASLTYDETRRAVAREKSMPSDLRCRITSGYDLVFVVLSEPYLVAVSEAFEDLPDGLTAFAFASNGSKPYIGDATWVPATEEVRSKLGTSWFRIRGELLLKCSEDLDRADLSQLVAAPSALDVALQ